MNPIDVSAVGNRLPQLVDAALNGEEVIIATADHQHVKLTPIAEPSKRSHRQFGSARGKISMSEDFDSPLDDFREYMQ